MRINYDKHMSRFNARMGKHDERIDQLDKILHPPKQIDQQQKRGSIELMMRRKERQMQRKLKEEQERMEKRIKKNLDPSPKSSSQTLLTRRETLKATSNSMN